MKIDSVKQQFIPIEINQKEKNADPILANDSVSIRGGTPDDFSNNMAKLKQMHQASNVESIDPPGSTQYWDNQVIHMANYGLKIYDPQHGGIFSHVTNTGDIGYDKNNGNLIANTEKTNMSNSRALWSFAAAYEQTGDKKYLEAAKGTKDFLINSFMKTDNKNEVYWLQTADKTGKPLEGQEQAPVVVNHQTYGLLGLIEYYKAIKDTNPAEAGQLLDIITRGHDFLNNNMADKSTGVFNGFFEQIDPQSLKPTSPPVKSYASTVYPLSSALLQMAEVVPNKGELLDQIKSLNDTIINKMVDPKTGFIKEVFDENWNEAWERSPWQKQGEFTIGVTGHNTQAALTLLRSRRLLEKEGKLSPEESAKYLNTAKVILDSMMNNGAIDMERGGSYDVFKRETHETMWHTNKAMWQQEEAYLAYKALAHELKASDPKSASKYQEVADKTLEFWDKYFVDRELGGLRATVTSDGKDGGDPKIQPFLSIYHGTEMAVLAKEIDNWK